MENGAKYVETLGDENGMNDATGPIMTGIRAKTRRGTASHKADVMEGRDRAVLVK